VEDPKEFWRDVSSGFDFLIFLCLGWWFVLLMKPFAALGRFAQRHGFQRRSSAER
jgi:hypothetical protein